MLRAQAHREGFASIGFGECRGLITPSTPIVWSRVYRVSSERVDHETCPFRQGAEVAMADVRAGRKLTYVNDCCWEGVRTPGPVCAAPPSWAGIRTPSQQETWGGLVITAWVHRAWRKSDAQRRQLGSHPRHIGRNCSVHAIGHGSNRRPAPQNRRALRWRQRNWIGFLSGVIGGKITV